MGRSTPNIVTVFGASGFIGRHVVQRLARRGDQVRVCVRDLEDAMKLKPLGDVGQIVPVACDITRPETLAPALAGASTAINLVGIIAENKRGDFQRIHVEGAENIAKAAKDAGVKCFVHMSALGADPDSPSKYAASKAQGEAAVQAVFADATIMRPSLVAGPEDKFFNLLAGLAFISPALPAIGCPVLPDVAVEPGQGSFLSRLHINFCRFGGPLFQPVFVGDVADAIMRVIDNPSLRGRTYHLGGPGSYTYGRLLAMTLAAAGRKRIVFPMPYFWANFWAWFLEKLPGKLLTRDQVAFLREDNIVIETSNTATFEDLGLTPRALETVLPTYLGRFRPPTGHRLRPSI